MSESTGNVILGRHTENTHVVNELWTCSLLCEGVKDLIVAANSGRHSGLRQGALRGDQRVRGAG